MTTTFVASHSILDLSGRHPDVRRVLLDAHAQHVFVMRGFNGWVPEGAPDARAQLQVLHVSTIDLEHNQVRLVVQARVRPDWSAISPAVLARDPETYTTNMAINIGARFQFRTIINPARDTLRHLTRDMSNSREARKRLADTTARHARQWFQQRLQPPGEPAIADGGRRRIGAAADPETLAVRIMPKLTNISTHPGLRVGRAEIKGELTITDPDAFLHTLTHGLGRARAYGCGLVLVHRSPDA